MSRTLLALAVTVLLLTVGTRRSSAADGAEPGHPPTDDQERCVFKNYLNMSQSQDIACHSASMQRSRSTINHRVHDHDTPGTIDVDIIHCEAPSDIFINLHLYYHAAEDGATKQIVSLGKCLFTPDVNCTRLILYLNLTHYDQHNGSVIPVCGFNKTDLNLNCFCLRYLLHLSEKVTCRSACDPMIVTESTVVCNTSTTKSNPLQPSVDLEICIQPAKSISGSGVSVGAFGGTLSLLVLVIVVLVMVFGLVTVFLYKKSNRTTPNASVRFTRKVDQKVKIAGSGVDEPDSHESRTVADGNASDEDHNSGSINENHDSGSTSEDHNSGSINEDHNSGDETMGLMQQV